MFVFIVSRSKPLEMKNSISDDYIRCCFSFAFALLIFRRVHRRCRWSPAPWYINFQGLRVLQTTPAAKALALLCVFVSLRSSERDLESSAITSLPWGSSSCLTLVVTENANPSWRLAFLEDAGLEPWWSLHMSKGRTS